MLNMKDRKIKYSFKKYLPAIRKYNFYNVILIILLSLTGINLLHKIFKGAILSSALYTTLSFFFFVIILSLDKWPWMKLEKTRLNGHFWWIISILNLGFVIYIWVGQTQFPGDYTVHKMYVLQLLNGFAEGHMNYSGVPGIYPPLAHTSMAVLSNLSGMSIHHCYFLLTVLIAFLIPLAAYHLASELGLSRLPTFFFASFISVWRPIALFGLFRYQWFFDTALSFTRPAMPRNLNIITFLIFLALWFRIYQNKSKSFNNLFSLGIIGGLAGLTHPQCFFMVVIFLLIGFLLDTGKKESYIYTFIPLIAAGLISSLYYLPFLYNIINYGGIQKVALVSDTYFGYKRILHALLHPWTILIIFGLTKKDLDLWIKVTSSVLISLFAFFIISSSFPHFKEVWTVFRMRRFAQILVIFGALLASNGIERILSLRSIKRGVKFSICLVLSVIITMGYVSTYIRLNKGRGSALLDKNNFVLEKMFPDGVTELEKLRFNVRDPKKTILSPAELSRIIARYAGLDVPFVQRHRIHFKKFLEKTVSQEDRYAKVRKFYNHLNNKGKIRRDILEFFNSHAFFAKQDNLHQKLNVIHKTSITAKQDEVWHLYELEDK